VGFSRASVRDEAATKMDDGLAARFFSYSSHEKVFTAVDVAGTAFAEACLGRRQSLEAEDGAGLPPIQLGADGTSEPPPPGGMSLEQAADVLETVLSAYWFHVLGVCVHLVISGGLASEERLRAAEYGLAVAVATTWHRSHVLADLRASETRRGGVAWAATTETQQKYSVTLFAHVVDLSPHSACSRQCFRHNACGALVFPGAAPVWH
jgi:hypothetical protein